MRDIKYEQDPLMFMYIVDYINEEIDRGNEINYQTIQDAIDSYNGGQDTLMFMYIVDFINEEIDRGNEIDYQTIQDAIDSYNGGAE